jgi:glycine betaine/proline transport system ATP-binding protein
MSNQGVTSMPVVGENGKFIGFVKDTDMKEMEDKGLRDIQEYMYSKEEVTAVTSDTPVADLLPLFLDTDLNLAVVDENRKLVGVVVHSSVIAEMIGKERDEVKQIREEGGIDL